MYTAELCRINKLSAKDCESLQSQKFSLRVSCQGSSVKINHFKDNTCTESAPTSFGDVVSNTCTTGFKVFCTDQDPTTGPARTRGINTPVGANVPTRTTA